MNAMEILVHCGAGSTPAVADAAERALDAGEEVLRSGGSALDTVVAAVVSMEDDERLNAGLGSRLNLAGVAEMDASVMDSDSRCGAVAAIHHVKNPILVARKVMESPHVLLCGEGAVQFARKSGFPEFDNVTKGALEALEEAKKRLRQGEIPSWAPAWKDFMDAGTVGAVARDEGGRLAAANSTGGVLMKLPGRVGDTPLIGCGIYAGPRAAVTATGIGEEIIRRVLCKEVSDQISAGEGVQSACDSAIASFPRDLPAGVIAVSLTTGAAASNRDMAWGRRQLDS